MSNKPRDRTLKLEKNRKNKQAGEGERDVVKIARDKKVRNKKYHREDESE